MRQGGDGVVDKVQEAAEAIEKTATQATGDVAEIYRQQLDALDLQDDLQVAREAFFANPPPDLPEDPVLAEEAFGLTLEARTIRADLEEVEGRREDFYAYAALSVIFSAVDAYVAAQLDPLSLDADPSGRVRARIRMPLGGDR